MKANLHPQYHEVTVVCACGASFKTHSTKKELRLEICSECHPYFTGRDKLIDSAGMIERFQRRYNKPAPDPKVATTGDEAAKAPSVKAKPPAGKSEKKATPKRAPKSADA